jgi:anti-sigma factor RsiW
MRECTNAEIRDLLPDLAADRLSGADRTCVANHVAACADCAAEVELLRAARRVQSRGVPPVDTARILAALPKPPLAAPSDVQSAEARPALPVRIIGRRARAASATPGATRRRTSIASWGTWRIAAAATVAVGGLSLLLVRQVTAPSVAPNPVVAPVIAAPPAPSGVTTPGAEPSVGPSVVPPSVAVSPETSVARGSEQGLSVGGDLSELSDGDVEALLQDVDTLDARPAADPDAAAPGLRSVAAP